MKEWQEAALRYYRLGLGLKEITAKIETEFEMYDAYDMVRSYIYRQKTKGDLPEEPKRVVIQNQEPEHHTGKWDGTSTLRFAIMGVL